MTGIAGRIRQGKLPSISAAQDASVAVKVLPSDPISKKRAIGNWGGDAVIEDNMSPARRDADNESLKSCLSS
jgi:hypothetical protein